MTTPTPTNHQHLAAAAADQDSDIVVILRLAKSPLGQKATRLLKANAILHHQTPGQRLAEVLSENLGGTYEVRPAA